MLHSLCFTNSHFTNSSVGDFNTQRFTSVPSPSPLFTGHVLRFDASDNAVTNLFYNYSLNMYVLQSPFLFYKCNVFTKFPRYDCYPDNVYHSPCFCRLPFTSPRLSRFAHAVQILHSYRFALSTLYKQGWISSGGVHTLPSPGPMQGFHFEGFFPF